MFAYIPYFLRLGDPEQENILFKFLEKIINTWQDVQMEKRTAVMGEIL